MGLKLPSSSVNILTALSKKACPVPVLKLAPVNVLNPSLNVSSVLNDLPSNALSKISATYKYWGKGNHALVSHTLLPLSRGLVGSYFSVPGMFIS